MLKLFLNHIKIITNQKIIAAFNYNYFENDINGDRYADSSLTNHLKILSGDNLDYKKTNIKDIALMFFCNYKANILQYYSDEGF